MTRRVQLTILGQTRDLDLPFSDDATTLADLLPAAREASRIATDLAIAAGGRPVSCRAGCAACCRQIVPISVVEARAIARAVDALPDDRRRATRARFAQAVKAMEAIGILDPGGEPGRARLRSDSPDPRRGWAEVVSRYWSAQIACPLLVDERCSLYDERPLVCREYHVTSPPERCADPGAADAVKRPLPGSEILATAARSLTEEDLPLLPLPLSLEWGEAAGGMIDQPTDPENLLNHWIAAADDLAR